MSNTGTHAGTGCLDLEDLAAFADRRLSGAERQRAVEHLADCERCYEIYAEVVSFQEDDAEERLADESAERRAEVVAHPRARRWLWPATGALAAAALAVLVVAPLVRQDVPTPPAGWDTDREWPTFRSAGPGPVSQQGAAFQLGVLGVDLEVALAAGRAKQASSLSDQLVARLESVEGAEPLQVLYEQISQRLSDENPAGLIRDAEAARGLLEDFVEPSAHYALGRWAEEARAAALVGERRFLTGGATRRFLRELENVELPEEIARELDAVRARIAGGLTDEDLAALERSLARVIELGGSR